MDGVQGGDGVRNTILDHAERLFSRDGYAATTLQRIAKHANIDVDTVYKTFGSKPNIVRAIRDRALFGGGSESAEQRSNAMQARETDLKAVFHGWAELSKELSPRVSPLHLLIRDTAPTDRDMARLQQELDEERLARMDANATRLERFGVANRGRARDIMWLVTSPELYDLLVVKRGWSIDDYGTFIEQVLNATV